MEKNKTPASEYKVMMDLVKEVNDQLSTLKTSVENSIMTRYHLDPRILKDILKYKKV